MVSSMMNHLEAKKLFSRYGIELEGKEYTSIADAEKDFNEESSYFLKLVSSHEEATHKTEFGYVKRVTSKDELRAAWDKMTETANTHGHGDISFILQEQKSGHEVLIGAKRDPIFGFQIIFTPEGGKYAEIVSKAVPPSVRIGKLSEEEALELINDHVLSAKIKGARGEEPADIESLAKLIVKVSTLMDENPNVLAIDLNPVFVRPDGISMVDMRVEWSDDVKTSPVIDTNRSLMVFIRPKRAFVVLASAKANSVGMKLLENVLKSVGDAKVMLPTGKGIENLQTLGIEVVDDVPDGCDLLVYAGMPHEAPGIVKKFREKGGEGAVIISSDFAETGNQELENELKEAAGAMPYVGPNCLGVYSASHNTFFVDEARTTYPATDGKFAFFTQSGSLGVESFCEYMSIHGIPVSAVFSLGNGSGVNICEIVNRVADEPSVNALVMHLEGGLKEGEGRDFLAALKKATKIKPVIILPAGLSQKGRQSAASHTGRMTGSGDALRAALKQGGAIVVQSEEQLRLVIWMLHVMPKAMGKTVVFTGGGGKGVLATDAAERVGLELRDKLPKEFGEAIKGYLPPFAVPTNNPFDFTGSVTLDGMIGTLIESKKLDSPGIFYYGYHVPGATLTFKDGKPVGIDALSAIETVANTIKDNELPFILHIIGQTGLARAVERKAEESGIIVTRTSSADMVLGALKVVTEVWHKYPEADLRTNWNLVADTSMDCLKNDPDKIMA